MCQATNFRLCSLNHEFARDSSVRLAAAGADLRGGLQCASGNGKDNIGDWIDPQDTALWDFKVHRSGKFKLSAEAACLGEGSLEVIMGAPQVRGVVKSNRS